MLIQLLFLICSLIYNIKVLLNKDSFPSKFRFPIDFGDKCIQNFHFGRYIVGYSIGTFGLWRRIYDDVQPQIKMLNMIIPILMYFLIFTNQKQRVCDV